MKQRNAARRFGKVALRNAGPTPRESLASAADHLGERKAKRQRAFERAIAAGLLEVCDRCGAAMVLRVNSRTREPFFGCSAYPECLATRKPKRA